MTHEYDLDFAPNVEKANPGWLNGFYWVSSL